MSATGSTLVSRVRDLIQEESAITWTSAQIREILNLTLDEIWEVVELAAITGGWLLQSFTEIALVADAEDITLPTNLVNIDKIEILTSGGDWLPLSRLPSVKEFTSGLTAVDPPTRYLPLASTLKLMPPPSQARASALKIWGSAEPTHFTAANLATATSGLPFKCDRVLILGAVAMILDTEGSPVGAGFNGRYQQALAQLPGKLDRRTTESLDPEDDRGHRRGYPGGEDLDG